MKNEESIFDKYNTKDENENANIRQLKDLDYFLKHTNNETPLIVSEGNKAEGVRPLFMKRNSDNSLWYSTCQASEDGKIKFTIQMPIVKEEDGIKLNTHVTQKMQITKLQLNSIMKQYNISLDEAQSFKWRDEKFY